MRTSRERSDHGGVCGTWSGVFGAECMVGAILLFCV